MTDKPKSMIDLPQGAIRRRPGLEYISEVPPGNDVRLTVRRGRIVVVSPDFPPMIIGPGGKAFERDRGG
jgi:hypothetical protein